MLDNSIILTDGTTPRTVTLVPTEGSGTLRRESASGLITPFTLRISTSEIGSSSKRYFRHLVRIGQVKEYTINDTAVPKDEDVYIVIQRPREQVAITDLIWKCLALAKFLNDTSAANLTKILNGEQ